ncbi:uncharacterized protein PAC_16668 [Phialocephala subalpina]|uniref:Uncharacterized protein n=1 Tax=Phialocephala subalpina TaxID=576137 RepID=A0A1L7XP71_9HELO|nr:uncharacterized protein PAC_16668 [Phialocephala subalpina]
MENHKSPADNEERKAPPPPPSRNQTLAQPTNSTRATPPLPAAATTGASSAMTAKAPRKKGPPRKLKFLTKVEWTRLSDVTEGYTNDLSDDQIEQLLDEFVDDKGKRKYDGKKLVSFWDKKRKADGRAATPVVSKNDFGDEEEGDDMPKNSTDPSRGRPNNATQPTSQPVLLPGNIANLRAQYARYPPPRVPPWDTIAENVGLSRLAVQAWFYNETEVRRQALQSMNAGPAMGAGLPAPAMLRPPAPTGFEVAASFQATPTMVTPPIVPQVPTAFPPFQTGMTMGASPTLPPAPSGPVGPRPPSTIGSNSDDVDVLAAMVSRLFSAAASVSGSEDEGDG